MTDNEYTPAGFQKPFGVIQAEKRAASERHLTEWPEFEPMWESTLNINHPYRCECPECLPY